METDEVCDRPLETFGVHTSILNFYRKFLVCVLFVLPCNDNLRKQPSDANILRQRAVVISPY